LVAGLYAVTLAGGTPEDVSWSAKAARTASANGQLVWPPARTPCAHILLTDDSAGSERPTDGASAGLVLADGVAGVDSTAGGSDDEALEPGSEPLHAATPAPMQAVRASRIVTISTQRITPRVPVLARWRIDVEWPTRSPLDAFPFADAKNIVTRSLREGAGCQETAESARLSLRAEQEQPDVYVRGGVVTERSTGSLDCIDQAVLSVLRCRGGDGLELIPGTYHVGRSVEHDSG
jgi:hypothetical protein